jgi:hypothetical protein
MKFFKLRQLTVTCPECQTIFATYEVARMPPIDQSTPVESDLHRVLPDAELRSSLLAMCPNCIYTWWLSSFKEHHFLPQVVPDTPPTEPATKFAHAVASGRKYNVHALDKAVLALNGFWCAREEGVSGDKFLALAKKELSVALADNTWDGNRARYNYVMGEILRLSGEFQGAAKYFEQVDKRAGLPTELVAKMREFALSGNKNSVRLPPHIVGQIFVPGALKQNQL